MADCLITISGTSGEVILNYKVGGIPNSITTGIGTFSISDTVTNVTYTTLYGDAIASSGCLTITELNFICYKISWKGIQSPGYLFSDLIVGTDTFSLIPSGFPENNLDLAVSINELNIDAIKCISYKITYPIPLTTNPNDVEYSYIIQTSSSIVPILKIKNSDDTQHIYLHGEAITCTPLGYTSVNICNPILTV